MLSNEDQDLRKKLVDFLEGHQAFMPFDSAVRDFPMDLINAKAPNVEYTFWHLVEHIRFSQHDILVFCEDPKYKAPDWPKDYWPAKKEQATPTMWKQSVQQFQRDLKKMIRLIQDPQNDLFIPFAWGEGQHLAREAMLLANHNAYHIGELAILRQVMKAWPTDRKR